MSDEGSFPERRRSCVEMYAHFVWTTKGRYSFLTQDFERAMYGCIISQARAMDCRLLAIGGLPDHVHLVVRLPGKVAPAELMRRASVENIRRAPPEDYQTGYGRFQASTARSIRFPLQSQIPNRSRYPFHRTPPPYSTAYHVQSEPGKKHFTRATGCVKRSVAPKGGSCTASSGGAATVSGRA